MKRCTSWSPIPPADQLQTFPTTPILMAYSSCDVTLLSLALILYILRVWRRLFQREVSNVLMKTTKTWYFPRD